VSDVLNVLFVCTGNICRSPFAERLVRVRARNPGLVATASAGVRPLRGHAIDRPIAAALQSYGVDPHGHRARAVTAGFVAAADLVLTAESAHRARVLQMDPGALRRTFTLREFAHLGAALPRLVAGSVDDLHERVADVAAQRGHTDPLPPSAQDLGDPFGAPPEMLRLHVTQLVAAVDAAMDALGVPLDLS
jgi:protein-tyrosine phosphatase